VGGEQRLFTIVVELRGDEHFDDLIDRRIVGVTEHLAEKPWKSGGCSKYRVLL
jgi:hypothetical protein